jgi:hypothetical protein
VATGVTYQRAVRVLAQHLDCEPTERAVYERRLATDPVDYASLTLRASGAELLLVDDGYPPADVSIGWQELGRLASCPSRPVLRIERIAEDAPGDAVDAVRAAVATARERGYAALKTIAAYRGGLDVNAPEAPARTDGVDRAHVRDVLLAALEANEAAGDPLPVQVHTGFGDSDLFLPRADPGHLKPLVERFGATSFVLLHCYPFVREAGWLAHVYANVYFDLSLTIPHVSRPAAALAEALELAPVQTPLRIRRRANPGAVPARSHLVARRTGRRVTRGAARRRGRGRGAHDPARERTRALPPVGPAAG